LFGISFCGDVFGRVAVTVINIIVEGFDDFRGKIVAINHFHSLISHLNHYFVEDYTFNFNVIVVLEKDLEYFIQDIIHRIHFSPSLLGVK